MNGEINPFELSGRKVGINLLELAGRKTEINPLRLIGRKTYKCQDSKKMV